ncbi:5-aminolevulinate synthase [Streptosporangium saharense]|uniref:5-aminolevulinate synthase n=1 Tax=Streptosporangium saharense TaxID=1706840 RepID=UPI00331FD215
MSEHTNTLLGIFPRKIEELKKNGLYRSFVPFSHLVAEQGHAVHGTDRIQVWCTNDYLGLSQHPEIIRAQLDSTAEHGTGSGGSRNIAGTSAAHAELEARIAAWHGKERALVFSSGYVANFETLSTVISAIPDIVVFSDAKNHRSLIEGILRTRCAKHIFPHNDLDDLERALAEHDRDRPKLVVFESVYSMDGDVSRVSAICDLADRYNALTFVDETHAVGTRGPTGAGVCEEAGETRPTFVQGVFSKAFGTVGGYVAGPDGALDYVRSHAPGFIFTTSLPHSSLDATLRSLELVQNGDALRRALADNVRYLKQALRAAGIGFLDADSHLVPVLVPGAERVRHVARVLFEEHGVYVTPINYPSVPKGAERFRITVPPFRTPEQIDDFVAALRKSLDS